MTVNRGVPVPRAFYIQLRTRPWPTIMALAAIIAGTGGLVLGAGASRAFTIIGGAGGGALIAHAMGFLLTLGGVLVLAGAVRLGSLVQLLGLGLVSAGAGIYGAGVLIGLRANGWIAGTFALGVALAAAFSVPLLLAAAAKIADDAEG